MKIIQPSPYDGGNILTDGIAKFEAGNIDNPLTDSGISRTLNKEHPTMQIFGLRKYKGMGTLQRGDEVIKSGRTSGVSRGTVRALDGSAVIEYPDKNREKHDLILTSVMLEGGDSSSPLLKVVNGEVQPELCGQGFAGSSNFSLHIKPENIVSDPALEKYKLDFNYDFEGEDGEEPQPKKRVVILASADKVEPSSYTITKIWVEIPQILLAQSSRKP